MFFTVEKLEKRMAELEPFRYRDVHRLTGLKLKKEDGGAVGAYPEEGGEWQPIEHGGRWSGYDDYYWLAADMLIPEQWKDRSIVGRFDLGVSGRASIGKFEALLFLNGHPYQGVDNNHQEVLLDSGLAGTSASFRFRLWTGMNGYNPSTTPLEYEVRRAELCWLDEAADDLYYIAKATLQTLRVVDETRPEYYSLLTMLDNAFRCIDWSRPGSEAFYASIREAVVTFRNRLEQEPKTHAVVVRCIGHTHIDVAWLWRLCHTREKSARSFSTVLRLMEKYPEYVFLQTQPQLYDYIREDYPELYQQIRQRIAEGRWEAGGAMWLEADCNLVSGESLVRQILYGTRFIREEFGTECTYLWLPDVFGYSWSLPQILKKSGIRMFMTTKISWNQYNRMPHDTFVWRGIDGSEVITHFITTPDPDQSENGSFYYTYNGGISAHSVQGIWDSYRDKNVNRKLLLAYGYGDGGGGVNREMLEMRRKLAELPGTPRLETGRADEYFSELERTVRETDEYVHTWDGELYLELHRGTYTSQAHNKRMNRKLELAYRETEWMHVVAGLWNNGGTVSPSDDLAKGWKIILRNQFHDIIPGSSIREVYEDSRDEYEQACQMAHHTWQNAAASLTHPENHTFTVYNSASWDRTESVLLPVFPDDAGGEWIGSGEVCSSQRTDEGWLVEVKGAPSMGFTKITFRPRDTLQSSGSENRLPFRLLDDGIETPYYQILWNQDGQLTRIYDKEHHRDVLAPGTCGNVFEVFEDKPKSRHEAWDIDIYYQEKQKVIDACTEWSLVEAGMLRAIVRFTWSYMDSEVTQDLVVYAKSRRIDFCTKVDWQEKQQLLKVAFPVTIRATEATYDIQFGNVKRPTHWNTSWDYARFESVGHQWADLSERNYGVSLLNDCKYGYDIKDHTLRLTLIKSAIVPDPTADLGEHNFTYALYPHAGDWCEGETAREAWALNQPLTVAEGAVRLPTFSLLSLNLSHAMIDAVKPAEDGDGIVVRLHENSGARGELCITSQLPIQAWQETDLMENPLKEATEQCTIQCSIAPYEIKTFRVWFSPDKIPS